MPRRIPKKLMPHGGCVEYEALLGTNAYGQDFAAPVVPKRANIEDKVRLVRSSTGEQKVSSSRVWLDPDHHVPAGSRVTVWKGTANERTTTVIVCAYLHHPPLPEHYELSLE